jgi:hypothetical protein
MAASTSSDTVLVHSIAAVYCCTGGFGRADSNCDSNAGRFYSNTVVIAAVLNTVVIAAAAAAVAT